MGILSCNYSSYNSRDTGQYKLRDHRLVIQGPGANGTFRVPFEGALLITEGLERSVWQTIQATTLQFDILIESDSHIDFITSLVNAKENEYTVQYWRGGSLTFYGIVLTDEVVKQEGPRHILHGVEAPSGRHTITAIDGLTVLQGIPYWDETKDAPYNVNYNNTNIYRDKIITHIGRCMSDIPTAAGLAMEFRTYWSATPGGDNFMDTVWIDGDVFVKQKRGGGWESFSKWEVLKWFCEHFDMRLYFAAGRYIFEQLSGLQVPRNSFNFTLDGTSLGTEGGPVFGNAIVDCNTLKAISPAIETLQPALRSTEVIYDFDFQGNLLGGYTFNTSENIRNPSGQCLTDLIAVPVPNVSTRLSWKGTVEFVPSEVDAAGSLDDSDLRIVWFWRIKIGSQYFVRDVNNPGAGYYNNFDYEEPYWTTTSGYWVVVDPQLIRVPDSEDRKFYYQFYITTNPIPEALDGEDLSVCFGHELYRRYWDGAAYVEELIEEGDYVVEHWLMDGDIKVIDKDDNILEKTSITTTIVNDEGNSKSISRKIRFSDGPTDSSQNRMTNGQFESSPPTTEWRASNIGTYKHYELLARSMMTRGVKAQVYIEGAYRGPYESSALLMWEGKQAAWITGTYKSGIEEWDGVWWLVDINAASTKLEEETFLETGKPPNERAIEGKGLEPLTLYLTGVQKVIDVDSYLFPVPDTTNWLLEKKQARFEIYKQGVGMLRYLETGNILVDSFEWDNTNRDFILGEQTRQEDWLLIRIWV